MRLLVLLAALAAGNLLGYLILTRPAVIEQEDLAQRLRALEEESRGLALEASRWEELAGLVELADSVLRASASGEGADLSILREALLEAEEGLSLRRGVVEFRPEEHAPAGFRGYRVHVTQSGDFRALHAYLDRVSHVGVPLAPVELSLVEGPKGESRLLLDVTWLTLWPEGPES